MRITRYAELDGQKLLFAISHTFFTMPLHAGCSQGRTAAKSDQCPLFSLVSLVLRPARPPIGLACCLETAVDGFPLW